MNGVVSYIASAVFITVIATMGLYMGHWVATILTRDRLTPLDATIRLGFAVGGFVVFGLLAVDIVAI